MPIVEEDIDGLSGLLFPFYDADTHMLYLAGKVRTTASHKELDFMPVCSYILIHIKNKCMFSQKEWLKEKIQIFFSVLQKVKIFFLFLSISIWNVKT